MLGEIKADFCAQCGTRFQEQDRFCTECGSPRPPAAVQPSMPPVAPPPVLPPAPVTPQPVIPPPPPVAPPPITPPPVTPPPVAPPVEREWPTQESVLPDTEEEIEEAEREEGRAKRAWVATILVIALAVGGGLGGYWWFFQRLDYNATTVSALLGGNSTRSSEILTASCSSLKTKLVEVSGPISTASSAVQANYAEGLKTEPTFVSQTTDSLTSWAMNLLSTYLGNKVDKIKDQDAVAKDLYTLASQYCSLTRTPAAVLSDAKALDEQITQIRVPPADWFGTGYKASEQDPNIAWKWAPEDSFSCGYEADACNAVTIKVFRACPRPISVELGWRDESTGPFLDSDVSQLTGAKTGKVYTVVVRGFDRFYSWAAVKSITCG